MIVLAAFLFLNSADLFAQESARFQVSGVCGMCKTRIEKAAKDAGAISAEWDLESKMLAVRVASKNSVAAIQQKVAGVGHDNDGARASDDVYNKLHGCCKYERNTDAAQSTDKAPCCKAGETCKKDDMKASPCCDKPCCKDGKCANCADCCKDGKCTKGGACCPSSAKMDCSKDAKCAMPDHKGGDCSQSGKSMDCCKDGKCSMPGHSGAGCCKKS